LRIKNDEFESKIKDLEIILTKKENERVELIENLKKQITRQIDEQMKEKYKI